MAYEKKNNEGVAFANKSKVSGDNRPDFRGTITVAGVDYWVSVWQKFVKRDSTKYREGDPYLTLAVTRVEERRDSPRPAHLPRREEYRPSPERRRDDPPPPATTPADDFDKLQF